MPKITAAHLRAIAGGSAPLADALVGPINRHCAAHDIRSFRRLTHFLAHCSVETGGFKTLRESLNYSVEGLLKTFGRHRISEADARRLGRKPGERALSQARQREIANILYGGEWGRKNLGNIGPDDGWRHRGRGPKQTTGLHNYQQIKDVTGIDVVANPDLLAEPDTGTLAAAIYFAKRVAKTADRDDIDASTLAVNGGRNGLADRKAALARARKALGAGFVLDAPEGAPLAPPAPANDSVPDAGKKVAPPTAIIPDRARLPSASAPAPAPLSWWQRFLAAFRRV